MNYNRRILVVCVASAAAVAGPCYEEFGTGVLACTNLVPDGCSPLTVEINEEITAVNPSSDPSAQVAFDFAFHLCRMYVNCPDQAPRWVNSAAIGVEATGFPCGSF